MKERTLLDGTKVKELQKEKTLTVFTKCPEKYKLIDMETGQEYIGYATEGTQSWKRIKERG